MNNIIVLTHGWTGSSVFSALLGQAGCWLGAETMHKPDYNTFENADLVTLNNQLLQALAPGLNHEHHFSPAQVLEIEQRAAGIDSPYEAPEAPALRIDTTRCTAEQAADEVISKLRALGCIA